MHHSLVWLLMKLTATMDKLRKTMRTVGLVDMRITTDEKLSTMPYDGQDVFGSEFLDIST